MKGLFSYFTEVRQEAQRVTWATRKETILSTVMVLVMVALAAVFLGIVDAIISFGVYNVIGFGS
ncbi:MAG: SecE/Sec61-gamma subunit of protein translocation complex [Rickettsiales bacterium]|jgi:preprotein translocase subunit SecE|nr:SecE/Sec61-gamma subunit of protein translocation complex [Rickettsiales bacterium]